VIDLDTLADARVCDLGCGIGRWSFFLQHHAREIVLVDFSEAIFVARENLRGCRNAVYVMADLKRLPFREDFADFIFCLGVLHHLPTPALDEVRALRRYAPLLLIYLYYDLDNRPYYFRSILGMVTRVRTILASVKDSRLRNLLTWVIALTCYLPPITLGKLLRPFGLSSYIPLYDGYHADSVGRIRQDVYDRFFTRIEQRFTKTEIAELHDTFSSVEVSPGIPYWHFVCRR
jgi:SAM-dependent methyltransferase